MWKQVLLLVLHGVRGQGELGQMGCRDPLLKLSLTQKIIVFQLWGLDEEIGCLRSKTSEYVSLQSLDCMKLFRGENDEMIQTFDLCLVHPQLCLTAGSTGSVSNCQKWLFEDTGWQKLRGSTDGTRRKVWTLTKILSPNIRYFVAN